METISLFDMNNHNVTVSLVRFFKYNHDQYFIYTLNEQDLQGYVKIYLVKVIQDFGRCISYHISDLEEWKNTQNLLKNILSELKYNQERSFEDLDFHILNGIRIEKARVFKLEKKLLDLLSGSPDIIIEHTKVHPISRDQNQESYQKQYEEAKKEIDRLNEIMGELLAENIRYKTKYGDLE